MSAQLFELTEPQTFKDCFSNSLNIVGKKLAVFGLNLPVLKGEEATTWRTSFGDSEADQPVRILGTLSVCDTESTRSVRRSRRGTVRSDCVPL